MKFWFALVAATLLAGCGAELAPPTPPTPTPPAISARVWGLLELLGGAAENATERIRESPLAQRLRNAVSELQEFREEVRSRAAEYGSEARALFELSAADLRARGAAFARKLRKRLGRDSEELRRRWEGGLGALRALWGRPEPPRAGAD